MTEKLERLLSAGLNDETAWETANWFEHFGNDNDFERYVCELENGQRASVRDS